jgi:signal transduction histidine kinase
MDRMSVAARVEALDVFVELLAEVDFDAKSGTRDFYDRLCQALCTLTSMRRAGLLLYDPGSRMVLPVGSHGIEPDLLDGIYGTLEETPIAQRAVAEDRVVEVSSELEDHVPARYAHFKGVTTLTCTPVSAGGRPLGVIFADRGGEKFELSEAERHTMWSLGKTAALAATAHMAADRSAQARSLRARVNLARDLHESVIQRLCGVSLAISGSETLETGLRDRAERELSAAIQDLRAALVRPSSGDPGFGLTLGQELERLAQLDGPPAIEVKGAAGDLPAEVDRFARSVLAEALRNASKHAEADRVQVAVSVAGGTLTLEVRNDAARPPRPASGSGLGLRIAAFEALEFDGLLEYGPDGDGWHVRVVVPLS